MNFITKALTLEQATTVNYASDAISMTLQGQAATLNFAELASRADWGDFNLYALRFNPLVDAVLRRTPGVVNVFAQSLAGRRPLSELARDLTSSLLAQVFVPHAGVKSFDECQILFVTTSDVTANVSLTEIAAGSGDWRKQFTGLSVTGPKTMASGDTAEIDVQLTDGSGNALALPVTIDIEATAGYINKRRVTLDSSGKGSFKVRADLLDSGDSIKVKAGYRYYSGLASLVVGVQ
jgi:hypothetical protein